MIKNKKKNPKNTSKDASRLRQYRQICRLEFELQELSSSISQKEDTQPWELIAYTLGSTLHINRRGSIALLLRGTSVLYSAMNGWKLRSGLGWNIKMLLYRCRARIPLFLSGLL